MILTVGHSTHSIERFLDLLRGAAVDAVADVRRFPGSRRMPHFNSEQLAASLAEAGIDYVPLPELGGRRSRAPGSPNGGWQVPGFQGYADHMASDEFAGGLARLEQLAKAAAGPVAVMCAEANWWQCHRRLLADALLARGRPVGHLYPDGRTAPHELTEFAVVDGERVTYPPVQLTL